jgi:hypothetical protein
VKRLCSGRKKSMKPFAMPPSRVKPAGATFTAA